MEPESSQCAAGADGEQVLRGKDGGRCWPLREQLHDRRLCVFDAAEVEPHQAWIEGEVLGLQLLAVTLKAERRRHDALQVDEAGDPLMAVVEQVPNTSPGASEVVGQYGVRVEECRWPERRSCSSTGHRHSSTRTPY